MLFTIALASLPGPLNFTMLVVALPSIADDFGIGVGTSSWMLIAPMLASSSLQSIGGRLGDIFGYRRVFMSSMVGFCVVSAAAVAAPTFWLLVAARVLLVTFNGATQPNGGALVRVHLPTERRARGFGTVVAAFSTAATIGPLLGGVLVSTIGWRAVMAAGIPFTVAALVLAAKSVPPDPPQEHTAKQTLDVVGAVLLASTITSMVLPLTFLRSDVISLGQLPLAYLVLPVVLAAFVTWELRHPQPIVQPRLFASPTFRAAAGSESLVNVSFFPIAVVAAIYLQEVQHRSATLTGAVIAAGSVAMILFSPVGGRLADRYGRRVPSVLGRALVVAGLLPLLLIGNDTNPLIFALAMTIMSIGGGLSFAAVQSAAIESAPRRYSGMAAGVFATTSFLGGITGITASSVYLTGELDASQFRVIFVAFIVTAILAMAVASRIAAWPMSEDETAIQHA